jgi:chemotaxis methyl-accepting protein methylase
MQKEISNEPIDIVNEDDAQKVLEIFKEKFSIDLKDLHPILFRRRLALALKAQNICIEEFVVNDTILTHNNADQMLCVFFPDHSELFRDIETWLLIRDKVLNRLNENNILHVYFPYVITGEEIYSLLILINEFFPKTQFKLTVASLSDWALSRISNGYLVKPKNRSSLTNFKIVCEKGDLSYYLEKSGNTFCFKKSLLNNVEFVKFNFECGIENKKYDLVICRNKTLSFNHEKALKVLRSTSDFVKDNGIVVYGVNENVPKNLMKNFQFISWSEKIFQKTACE